MFFPTTIILTALIGSTIALPTANTSPNPFTARSTALGVNCRGSGLCTSPGAAAPGNKPAMLLDVIQTRINAIGQDNARNIRYAEGQQIACSVHVDNGVDRTGTCAFFQGPNYNGNYNLLDAANAMREIVAHGCQGCGSQPLVGNDVGIAGQLTVNYVVTSCVQAPHGSLNTMC